MRHRATLVIQTVMLVLCTSMVLARVQTPAPAAPPKPGPEVKQLGVFVGKWMVVGDVKPGGIGPGGKTTGTSTCKWISDGFAVLCSESATVAGMGKIADVNIMSYDVETKKYVIFQVNSWGDIWTALGTLDVDTWTWTSQDMVDGKTMQLRFTVKWTSKDSYDFKNEVGPDAASMKVMMDGKETRVTAPVPPRPAGAKPAPK